MGRLFGTDGVRGVAITELTCETAMNIGRAAALVLTKATNRKPKILIGKDTRISGDVLEAALVAGICSVGADAHILGVLPTPAVAMLVRKYEADAGIMISASHNPMEFNGIKLFSGDGFRLPDALEKEIEDLLLDDPENICLSSGSLIGRVIYEKNAEWDYVRHLMKTVDGDLRGLKIAVDCANGASCSTAEKLFKGLGASCVFINNAPDGTNINKECGSTDMRPLCKAVVDNRCSIGIAFDGDGGRCLACDENGNVIDGDRLLAVFSRYMKAKGTLKHNACVVTVMTNLGFFRYAKENGVIVATTQVGDRYVLEEMKKGGYNLGGEQSGHIVFLDHATTGDGELTAVRLLEIMCVTHAKASELAGLMTPYPQVLKNVSVPAGKKGLWQADEEISSAISTYKAKLGDDGRILIRESETEPLVRVMVEGRNFGVITEYAAAIAGKIADFAEK